MHRYLFLFALILLFSACANQERSANVSKVRTHSPTVNAGKDASTSTYSNGNKETVSSSAPSAVLLEDNAEMYNRQIIKNADCKIRVENVESSTNKIQHAVALQGGFVSNMDLSTTYNSYQNNMTLRVPQVNFEELFNTISKEAISFDYKRINTDDVTEQFVDIESRLKTKKEVQKRYTEILRKKAHSIEEVLETEEKIRRLQEEIDAKEGRLRYLSSKVDLSTVTLKIYELKERPEVVAVTPVFMDKLKDGFMNGWNFILNIFLVLANIWPLILLISFLVLWKGKWVLRKVGTR